MSHRTDRAAPILALALLFVPVGAGANNLWFAGGGMEFPRPGRGMLGEWNRGGPSFVAGLDWSRGGIAGATFRVAWSTFPVDTAQVGFFRAYGTTIDARTATLGSAVAGLRLRRRDLAFSPYFDLGLGLGIADANRITQYGGSGPTRDESTTVIAWYWSWGTGIAVRAAQHYGVFVDGHWDTVPDVGNRHGWTGSVRAGVELQ